MTAVFVVAGNHPLERHDSLRLDNIIRQQFSVLIGDASTDKAVQSYFASQGYRNVTVYCMNRCRNNVAAGPQARGLIERRKISWLRDQRSRDGQGGFVRVHLGWQSRGSLNILNLLSRAVLVYFSPERSCHALNSLDDLSTLLDKCAATAKGLKKYSRPRVLPFPCLLRTVDSIGRVETAK